MLDQDNKMTHSRDDVLFVFDATDAIIVDILGTQTGWTQEARGQGSP